MFVLTSTNSINTKDKRKESSEYSNIVSSI